MSFAHSGKFSAFALPQATAIASPAVTKIKPTLSISEKIYIFAQLK
jgi:hypothetical protein